MRLSSVFLIFSLVILLANLPKQLSAQDGGQAGAYLRLGAGVRALGMGGAFVAAANDVTAGYWNPAGLSELAGLQFIGMHALLALDRQYNFAAAAYPFGAAGALSISWVNYSVGNIPARDGSGNITGEFADSENALLISYGKAVRPRLAVGGTVKWLRHDLAGHSAAGIGFDLGLRFAPREFIALGAGAQNLQAKIYWDNAAKSIETFPRQYRLGAQITPAPPIHLNVDYEVGKWHVGGEFIWRHLIGVRAGNNAGAMTLGVSFLPTPSRQAIAIDYGLTHDPIGGSLAHQFSILVKFNKPQRSTAGERLAIIDSSATPAEILKPVTSFLAQVIEVRPPFYIIVAKDLTGLENGMRLKVYQSRLGDETGRYYGAGEALDVSLRYAIIKFSDEKFSTTPAVGETLLMRAAD